MRQILLYTLLAFVLAPSVGAGEGHPVRPQVVTEKVEGDPDDPAIWVDPSSPEKSLILGTDKKGGLVVFGLDGRIRPELTRKGLGRMNNVDVEYGFEHAGETIDVAVATDRDGGLVRVYRLPEMTELAPGGLPVFEGEPQRYRRPMGVGLYRRPSDGSIFVVLSRKDGPSEGYLWQYRLESAGPEAIRLVKVRELGRFGGEGEIEAVAVDDELGYVYYSDEAVGVRKVAADPDGPERGELALFATDGFARDREGIAIYRSANGTGWILVSDQQAQRIRLYPREGIGGDPHAHPEIGSVRIAALRSDGLEVTSDALSDRFASGLFVAMSDDRTFHLYAWDELLAGVEPTDPHDR